MKRARISAKTKLRRHRNWICTSSQSNATSSLSFDYIEKKSIHSIFEILGSKMERWNTKSRKLYLDELETLLGRMLFSCILYYLSRECVTLPIPNLYKHLFYLQDKRMIIKITGAIGANKNLREKWFWSLSLRLVYPLLHNPPGATITSRFAVRIRINFWRMVGLYISFGDCANALECWRSPSLRLVIPGIAVSPGVTHSESYRLCHGYCRGTPTNKQPSYWGLNVTFILGSQST